MSWSKKALLPAVVLMLSALACNMGEITADATPTPEPTATTAQPTPSGTEQAESLVGDYYCSGHEAGMLAAAALLELTAGGQAIDVPPPGLGGERRTGTWAYAPATGELTFGGELNFVGGEYSSGSGRIVVRLQEGVARPHAERGVLTCEPR